MLTNLSCSRVILAVLLLLNTPPLLADGEASVHISGDIAQASDWTLAQLKEKFASEIKLIQYSSHGQKHVSNCIPLLSVLKAAGVSTEAKMDPAVKPTTKNRPLHIAVWIQGRDGYSVVLGLGELIPEFGNRPGWLALDADGKPLPEAEGPVKLVLPDDVKPGRWVHGIAEIIIEDHAPATTKPVGSP
jgi:hypothetical protein